LGTPESISVRRVGASTQQSIIRTDFIGVAARLNSLVGKTEEERL